MAFNRWFGKTWNFTVGDTGRARQFVRKSAQAGAEDDRDFRT
jgi:hypothetical protein